MYYSSSENSAQQTLSPFQPFALADTADAGKCEPGRGQAIDLSMQRDVLRDRQRRLANGRKAPVVIRSQPHLHRTPSPSAVHHVSLTPGPTAHTTLLHLRSCLCNQSRSKDHVRRPRQYTGSHLNVQTSRAKIPILTIYYSYDVPSQTQAHAQAHARDAPQKTQACTPVLHLRHCYVMLCQLATKTLNAHRSFAILCSYNSAPAMHVEGHEYVRKLER